MKPGLKSTLLLCFVLSLALLTTSLVQASPNPFVGKWYSIDPVDGSQQWIAIGGGNDRVPITAFDKGATACTPAGTEELYPARIKGWGSLDGLTLSAVVEVWCQQGPRKGFLGNFTFVFQYDSATGTVIDNTGAVWHR